MNIEWVFFAIKPAIRNDTGVSTTTSPQIRGLIIRRKKRVPITVIMLVKSFEKPRRSPSANKSTSEITRLTTSPVWVVSK